MARDAELRARVTAKDDASKTLDEIARAADKLDGSTSTVSVEVDDTASDTLGDVSTSVDELDGSDAEVAVDADDEASATLDDVSANVDDLDGAAAAVAVEADDEASDTLGDVQSAVDDLDGAAAEVSVEVDDNASAGLDDVKSKLGGVKDMLGKLPGPFGQLGGMLGSLGSGMSGVTAGLSAGVAAFAGLATDAIGDFQRLGIAVKDFVTKTGASFEDASRIIEVTDDLGVGVDAVESAIGRMNRTAENTPQAFDAIGASVVRNQDGTLNAKETFLSVIGALEGIEDAGKRADAGFAIFGKGWAGMAPLIGAGAKNLRASLDDVADAKIFDEAKANKALALRDSFDKISDAVDVVKNRVAEALVPAVETIAPAFADAVEGIAPFLEIVGKGISAVVESARQDMELLQDAADALGVGFVELGTDWSDFTIGIKKDVVGKLADDFHVINDVTTVSKDKIAALDDQTQTYIDTLNDTADALQDNIDAQNDLSDSLSSYADTQQDVIDNQRDFDQTLADYNTTAKDSKATQQEVDDALRDTISSAATASKGFAQMAEDQAKANGETVSATAKLDAQNASLLASASSASGPARQGILDYTFALNGIPPEKQTDIIAALNRGDVDEAKRLIDEASRNREATIRADTDNASLNQTNRDLDWAARNREAMIFVKTSGAGFLLTGGNSSGKSPTTPSPPPPVPGAFAVTALAAPVAAPTAVSSPAAFGVPDTMTATVVVGADTRRAQADIDELTRNQTMTITARVIETDAARWYRLNGRTG